MTSFLPNYKILRTIGHGSFGYVFEAWSPTDNRKVAIKRIHKVSNQLSREFSILEQLIGLPNIIQISDIFISRNEKGELMQNLIFNYVDRNLEDFIQINKKGYQQTNLLEIQNIAKQALNGLLHIHRLNIAHRDLKPENILMDDKNNIFLCDFGSAKKLSPTDPNTPYVVSQYYRAPELILSKSNYGCEIDIWSMGCILYELVTNKILFVGTLLSYKFYFILKKITGEEEGQQLYKIFEILGTLSEPEMFELFKNMMNSKQIMSRFMNFSGKPHNMLLKKFGILGNKAEQFQDLLMKMIKINPAKRITAYEALQHEFFRN